MLVQALSVLLHHVPKGQSALHRKHRPVNSQVVDLLGGEAADGLGSLAKAVVGGLDAVLAAGETVKSPLAHQDVCVDALKLEGALLDAVERLLQRTYVCGRDCETQFSLLEPRVAVSDKLL